MGYASREPKERICPGCGDTLYVNAKNLADHAEFCKRAQALGLIMPSLVVPQVGDLTTKEK